MYHSRALDHRSLWTKDCFRTQLSDFFQQQIWTLFWFVPDCFPVLKTKYKTQLWIWIQVCDRNTKCRRRLGVERLFWSHFSHERLHKYQQSFRIFCARSDLIFYLLSKYNTHEFKSCKWMDGRTESNIRIHCWLIDSEWGGQQPGRRSLEGVGEVLGFGLTFCDFCFHTRSLFSITCDPGDGRACPCSSFWPRWMGGVNL